MIEEDRRGLATIRSWLNRNVKVLMSDGRLLVGIFLCTDRSVTAENFSYIEFTVKVAVSCIDMMQDGERYNREL